MKLKEPLYDNVIVEMPTGETTTESGLIINRDDINQSTIVADVIKVGPGRRNNQGELLTPPVKPGDKVLFMAGRAIDVKDNEGKTFGILKATDIFTTVEV